MRKILEKSGVTIIELLITTSLISMVGLAVYSSFASGIRIWQRGRSIDMAQREAKLEFENVAKEIRNSFQFQGIEFKGSAEEFSFPAYIQNSDGESTFMELGTVTYFFDEGEKTLSRKRQRYHELFSDLSQPKAEVILRGINKCLLSYYAYSKEYKDYIWQQEWQNEFPPQAIKFELSGFSQGEDEVVSRVIYWPVDYGDDIEEEVVEDAAEAT